MVAKRSRLEEDEVLQISGLYIGVGLMLAVAGLLLMQRAHQQIRLAKQVMSWKTVTGVVVRSQIRVESDAEGDTYTPEITCSYDIDGRSYRSSRHTLGYPQSATSAQAVVAAFPPGQAVELRLDPQGPEVAVLITGEPERMRTLQALGAVAVLMGLGLSYAGLSALLSE